MPLRSTYLGFVALAACTSAISEPPTTHTIAQSTIEPSNEAAFDRGAAAASLARIPIEECRTAGGPSGPGHVVVTFDQDGTVGSAVVDGGPYPGTGAGACIAAKFRKAHVPAFAGAPVRVGKSFRLE